MANSLNLPPLQPNCFKECPAFPSCTKYFRTNLKAQKWNSKLTLIPRVRIILCKSQLTAGLIPNNLCFYTIKEPLSRAQHKIRCCTGQRLRKPTSIWRIYTNKSINSEEWKEQGCTLQVAVAVGLRQTMNCFSFDLMSLDESQEHFGQGQQFWGASAWTAPCFCLFFF